MNRQLAIALVFVTICWFAAAGRLCAAEPLTAYLEKARGSVTEAAGAVGAPGIALKTDSTVPVGRKVTVGRFSLAIYTVAHRFLLKQDPRTSLEFTSITHTKGADGVQDWNVNVNLDNGDLYTALRAIGGTKNYDVTTSRIEAVTQDAVFRVSHAYSTSIVYVKEGTVEVFYCYHSKSKLVHAGEAFIVTDCEGILRWQTDEEGRELTLFAALLDAGFGKMDNLDELAPIGDGKEALPPVGEGPEGSPGSGALDGGNIDPAGLSVLSAALTVPANLPPISP